MMWGTGFGAGGWAMMIGAVVVTAIVIAVVLVGAVWLLRTQHAGPGADPASSAGAILNARYARGEISESELMQSREVLANSAPGNGAQTTP